MTCRKLVNAFMLTLTGICALVTVSVLLFILGYLVWYGGRSINWAFLTHLPAPAGDPGGGMGNAIVGTAKLLFLTALIGVPVGFIAGVHIAEFGHGGFPALVRYTADLLNGVPSIVIGIFAYALVVVPMRHFSAFAGAVALSIMVIPITIRTTEQFLRAVPLSLREAALALGASKWRTVATVVVPAAFRGILTGTILRRLAPPGLGRRPRPARAHAHGQRRRAPRAFSQGGAQWLIPPPLSAPQRRRSKPAPS
jgi:phosphate transport system permease protein